MPLDYSSRSAKAYENGRVSEAIIKQLLPGIQPSDVVDGVYLGAPIEFKSCQLHVDRGGRNNPRSGRFYLRDYQHKELTENNGRYIFLVMQGKKVIHSKIILASKLSLSFAGAKTLSWPKVIQ